VTVDPDTPALQDVMVGAGAWFTRRFLSNQKSMMKAG